MRVQVKENRDGEQVSTCDVDKLERVELTFFLLRRGQIRERNLLQVLTGFMTGNSGV